MCEPLLGVYTVKYVVNTFLRSVRVSVDVDFFRRFGLLLALRFDFTSVIFQAIAEPLLGQTDNVWVKYCSLIAGNHDLPAHYRRY